MPTLNKYLFPNLNRKDRRNLYSNMSNTKFVDIPANSGIKDGESITIKGVALTKNGIIDDCKYGEETLFVARVKGNRNA